MRIQIQQEIDTALANMYFDVGVFLLEVAACSRDGAPRAHSAHEDIQLASSVLPNLRASGEIVDLGNTMHNVSEPKVIALTLSLALCRDQSARAMTR